MCEYRGDRPGLPWAPVPNKPTVSLDVKQHSTNSTKFYARRAVRASRPGHARIICSGHAEAVCVWSVWEIEGCALSHRHYTTGTANKFQALVYDILPSTAAVFSYAIGSRKLSANEQFFVGAQTVASLLQTTQIKQGVPFIAVNKVYTSANKTTIV